MPDYESFQLGADAVRAATDRPDDRADDTRDSDGFWLDEYCTPWGHCNACGEEAQAYTECCEEGEVVPE